MGVKWNKNKKKKKYRRKPRWFQLLTSGAGPETLDQPGWSLWTLAVWSSQYALQLGGQQGLAFLGSAIRKIAPRLKAAQQSVNRSEREEADRLVRGLNHTRGLLQAPLAEDGHSNGEAGSSKGDSKALERQGHTACGSSPTCPHPECLTTSQSEEDEPWWRKVGRDW